jgi:exopolysaccharide biosynthesis polyprenyl glycosylphosphotransferase
MFIIIPIWLCIFTLSGLYNRQNLLGGTREYDLIFRATTVGFLLVILAGFLEPRLVIARGWLLTTWGGAFLLTTIGRFSLRRVIYLLRKNGYFLIPAIIVGANSEGRSLAEQLLNWQTAGLAVIGFIDDRAEATQPLGHHPPILGPLDDIGRIIEEHKVEEVIIATSALSREGILGIIKDYGFNSHVNLRLSSGIYEIITTGLTVKEFAYVPLVGINKVRLTGGDKILKLLLDYCLTIPGLILALPIYLVITIAIRIDSPGPIIYRRRVMGVNGRQFDAFKFRTMHINGDDILAKYPELQAELSENQKLKNDPRLTRIGRILRQTSLDELPQLINVLKHEMSLVGPRMICPDEVKKYNQWGINLLTVQPGITGLWQVSGRSDVSYEDRIRLDMQYIRNWSIWLDLQLLWQTIPAVLRAKGAY